MEDGYLEMYGLAVRMAIIDYQETKDRIDKINDKIKKYKRRATKLAKGRASKLQMQLRDYENAKSFLFNPEWLEKMIQICALPLEIEYIRRVANGESIKDSQRNRYTKPNNLTEEVMI